MESNTQQAVDVAVAMVSTWGLRVLGALAVLILGRMIAGLVRRGVLRALSARNVDPTLLPFVGGLAYYFVLAVVVIAVLGLFGVQTASLVAVLGAAGLAVGLALQGTLSCFSSGVMLLLFRPFGVGDFVELAGSSGKVREIGLFATTLDTIDNARITIPNSAVWGATIKNVTAYDTRRNDLVVGIAYGDDIEKAVGTIESVLREDERVLDEPAPVVAVLELADSSVNLAVRPWCATPDYWPLRFDLTRRLKERLEAAGCSIPFPQRDLHLHAAGDTMAAS